MPPISEEWDEQLKQKVKEAYHASQNIEAARQDSINRLPKNHDWRKIGPHVVCKSCHAEHSVYIGALKMLGKDAEGNYVITDIQF